MARNPFISGGQVADTATNGENSRAVGPMGAPMGATLPNAQPEVAPMGGPMGPMLPAGNALSRGAAPRGLGGVAPVRSGRSMYDPGRIAERVIRQSRGRVPGGVGGARVFSEALDVLRGQGSAMPMVRPRDVDPMMGRMDPGLPGEPVGEAPPMGGRSTPAPLPKVEQDKETGVFYSIGQDADGRPVRQLVPDAPDLTDEITRRRDQAGQAQVEVIPFFRPGEEPTYASGLPKLPAPGEAAPTPLGMLPVLRRPGGVDPLGGGPILTPPTVPGMTADDIAAAQAMGGNVRVPLPGGGQVDFQAPGQRMVKVTNNFGQVVDFPEGYELPENWTPLRRTGAASPAPLPPAPGGAATPAPAPAAAPAAAPVIPKPDATGARPTGAGNRFKPAN